MHNLKADNGEVTYWKNLNNYGDISMSEFNTSYLGLKFSEYDISSENNQEDDALILNILSGGFKLKSKVGKKKLNIRVLRLINNTLLITNY